MIYSLHQTSYSYRPNAIAIGPITAEFELSERVVLLGSNGSGKSTLLLLLAGLVYATSGTVDFDGRLLDHQAVTHDAAFRKQLRSRVGIVFQDAETQLFCPTVLDEIAFGLLQKFPRDEAQSRAYDALTRYRLDHLADASPIALSGGEKKRVALAAILAMEPDILLLDEPSAHLDAATLDDLLETLDDFVSASQRTIVTATHDLQLAAQLGTRALVLGNDHRLLRDASTKSILDDSELLRTAHLLSRRRR